jgi:hypothetical protein
LRAKEWNRLVFVAAAWIAITLLPYSFLAYMPFVPSRHTYFATVGLALVIGAAFRALSDRGPRLHRVATALAVILVLHHTAYIWTKKHGQFVARAEPTEKLLDIAQSAQGPIYIRCFPYSPQVAELAVQYRSARPVELVFTQSDASSGVNLCSESEWPAGYR